MWHVPRWLAKPGQLTAACRAALRAIDLHVHDLRREFACRLLESAADLHDVRDFLGHANITTTSKYLKSTPVRLANAIARMQGEDYSVRTPFAHEADQAADTVGTDVAKVLN